jgi:hypothetical protein
MQVPRQLLVTFPLNRWHSRAGVHRGAAPTNKRGSTAADYVTKKQKTANGTKSRQAIKVMKASFMLAGGQTMDAILVERKNPGAFQGEQD